MTQELRKLAEAATQGKRHHWVNKRAGGTHVQLSAGDNDLCCRIEIASTTQADIDFIAAANPAAILALLDERDQLQARLDAMGKGESVAFMSPEQLELIKDPEDESGHYIPLRKTAAGKFVMALYAAPKALAPLTDERQPLTKVLEAVREYLPPDGITAKDCLSKIIAIIDPWPLPVKPLIALTDEEISLMAHNEDEGDWNDLRCRDCWHEGYKAGARATEAARGIQKGGQHEDA